MSINIIYNQSHPLALEFKNLKGPFQTHCLQSNGDKDFSHDHLQNFLDSLSSDTESIFDFTLLSDSLKDTWLEKLTSRYQVVSDTTCNWGEFLCEKYESLTAVCSLSFYSPKKKVEVYSKSTTEERVLSDLEKILSALELSSFKVSSSGHGFTYPRTVSTLINEAYFALEDELATREDMDQAMSFGVNYPHGLFAWSKKIGIKPILMLLQSLHSQTGDPRYRSAPLLMRESLK